MPDEILIKTNNISFRIDKKDILQNISIEIKKSDFTTIIGPNGAGKTTLLKILLGILKPTSGSVELKKDLKIGYLPQKIYIDNSIPLSSSYFLQLNKDFTREKLQKVVKETHIEKIIDKQISKLSGGELQRLLLANALIKNPDILILDEPDQNLDISGQLQFYELLNEVYKQRGVAILMVSHDLHLVLSSTKQVICLFHHICCSGQPNVISQTPEFSAIFGKDMSKMMAVYNHYHSHNHG